MKQLFLTFMIIFCIMGLLFSGAGTFYRAIQNDVPNTIHNAICSILDMIFLAVLIEEKSAKN